MYKVELKANAETLTALFELCEKVYNLPLTIDKNQKILRSISFDLLDTLFAKQKNIRKKISVQSSKKMHKITLKFHEAFVLEYLIMELINTVENPYLKMNLDKIKDDLNQKLG